MKQADTTGFPHFSDDMEVPASRSISVILDAAGLFLAHWFGYSSNVALEAVDLCVVGSGASGSVVAYELARQGFRVLVLEEGRALRSGDSLSTVEGGWESALVKSPGGRMTPFGRPWSASAVGGGMALYAGISFRFRAVDFDARQHVAPDALDPVWPIGYEDLRPYYDHIERCTGVSRLTGADPLEPDSGPAAMPPHAYSTQGGIIADAGVRIGMVPFPTPLAINSVSYGGRPACHRCGPCNEYVCPTGARADAASIFLDSPVPAGALTVAESSRAVRIGLRGSHRADSVEWLDTATRRRHAVRARCVVLAANAVQSAALLLRSAQVGAPDGVGNSSGMVGCGISFKVSGYVSGSASLPGPLMRAEAARAEAGPFSTVAFSDHYLDADAPSGLGGMIYEASAEDRSVRDGRIGLRLHFLAADQPMRGNAVRLASDTDGLGVRKIVIDYWTHPLDKRRLGYLARRASELLAKAGADDVTYQDSNYQLGSRHLHGGCRAGADPAESVVDRWGRVHDLDNLYVVDGGFFPYSGGVNPTFTIQANALRIARRIADEMRSHVQ